LKPLKKEEGYTSWHGFACAIREEIGYSCEVAPVKSEKFPRPAKRPANSRFDLAKSKSVPGARLVPWRDALRTYLAETRGQSL
jgi:dTDP-4-dehydrorhamnose reductase